MLEAELHPNTLDISLSICKNCGFIGLDISEGLLRLARIYYSSPSTIPGTTHGNNSTYATRRTDDFFSNYQKLLGNWLPESVLEVGCQAGFLLSQFSDRGSATVMGVEPGDIPPCHKGSHPGSVTIRRGFLSEDIVGSRKFDLVYSLFVLEHVEDLNEFMRLLKMHLNRGGRLLLAVPNEFYALRAGNLGMPVHQHFNYFTPDSIYRLLRNHGLHIQNMVSQRNEMLYILAGRSRNNSRQRLQKYNKESVIAATAGYSDRISSKLKKIKEIVSSAAGRVGLYGANASMANIFSWLPELSQKNIMIFDSDSLKWQQTFSGVPFPIQPPELMGRATDIIVIPCRLQKEIAAQLRASSQGTGMTIHTIY